MSGLINPHAASEETIYALLIELVRTQRMPQYEDEIPGLLTMYDEAVRHLEEKETERQAWTSRCEESMIPAEEVQMLVGQQLASLAVATGGISILTKQQRDMQFLILPCNIENSRNHREERIHVLAFKIITGSKRRFVNPWLHILRLRIERFDPPTSIRFTGGDMLSVLLLLFIQLDLCPR